MGKLRKVLMCVMLVIALVPLASAFNQQPAPQTQPTNTKFQTFTNCYVTIDGQLSEHDFPAIFGTMMWKMVFLRPDPDNEHYATILYWLMRISADATLTISSEENGEVLWEHSGTLYPEIRIVSFQGLYYWEDMMHISGQAKFVLIRERA